MRYGLISDVHGNLEALDAVLNHLDTCGIDVLAFMGDAVGYGASPDQVCDRLRSRVEIAVVGNHDAALTGRMSYDDYYDAAKQAIDWCVGQVSPKNRRWLTELPYKQKREFMEFSHGAPLVPEVFDYLFAAEQVTDLLPYRDDLAQVTFIGHSHLTVGFCLNTDSVTAFCESEVWCDPRSKYIITVGSVGQPRDRDPRACCGVFDTDSRVFTFHRVSYDMKRSRQKIIDAGLSAVFGDRLLVGM